MLRVHGAYGFRVMGLVLRIKGIRSRVTGLSLLSVGGSRGLRCGLKGLVLGIKGIRSRVTGLGQSFAEGSRGMGLVLRIKGIRSRDTGLSLLSVGGSRGLRVSVIGLSISNKGDQVKGQGPRTIIY